MRKRGRPDLFDEEASRTRVLLEVESENNNPPRCKLTPDALRIPENSPVGTQLDTLLEISDADWVRPPDASFVHLTISSPNKLLIKYTRIYTVHTL